VAGGDKVVVWVCLREERTRKGGEGCTDGCENERGRGESDLKRGHVKAQIACD
jgi:hypothetical protein